MSMLSLSRIRFRLISRLLILSFGVPIYTNADSSDSDKDKNSVSDSSIPSDQNSYLNDQNQNSNSNNQQQNQNTNFRLSLPSIACDLQSYIVDEASTKSRLLQILGSWDAAHEMQVVVLNGHFSTGKTYMSNILAKGLSMSTTTGQSASGKSSDNNNNNLVNQSPIVEILVTEDSFLPRDQFFAKMDSLLVTRNHRIKIIVFDDLPCWRDTERITRVLTRCLQFPNRCKGALFLITTNDGWCEDSYCNKDSSLDLLFDKLSQERTGITGYDENNGMISGTSSESVEKTANRIRERRCQEKMSSNLDNMNGHGMHGHDNGFNDQTCTLSGIILSKDECEHRGCCCVQYTNGVVLAKMNSESSSSQDQKSGQTTSQQSTNNHDHHNDMNQNGGSFSNFHDEDLTSLFSSPAFVKKVVDKDMTWGNTLFGDRDRAEKNGFINQMKKEGSGGDGSGNGDNGNSGSSNSNSDSNTQQGPPNPFSGPGTTHSLCDKCLLPQAQERLLEKLREASAQRSSNYIAKGIGSVPHLVVLGSNSMDLPGEAEGHWGRLLERMLLQTLLQGNEMPKRLGLMSLGNGLNGQSDGGSDSSANLVTDGNQQVSLFVPSSNSPLYGLPMIEIIASFPLDFPSTLADLASRAAQTSEQPRNLRSLVKQLINGGSLVSASRAPCTAGVCGVVRQKLLQILNKLERLDQEAGLPTGSVAQESIERIKLVVYFQLGSKSQTQQNESDQIKNGGKFDFRPTVMAAAVYHSGARAGSAQSSTPYALSRSGIVIDIIKEVSESLGSTLKRSFSNADFEKYVDLLIRKRRNSIEQQSGKPINVLVAIREDVKNLRTFLETTLERWKTEGQCPHLRIGSVKVIPPTKLPQECNMIQALEQQQDRSNNNRNQPIGYKDPKQSYLAINANCHIENRQSHWCTQQQQSKNNNHNPNRVLSTSLISQNPFYGTILLKLEGYPSYNVYRWMQRSQQEKLCDSYAMGKWIYAETIRVVPQWSQSGLLSSGSGDSGGGLKAPEIASESKLGCLREEGPGFGAFETQNPNQQKQNPTPSNGQNHINGEEEILTNGRSNGEL